MSDSAFRRLILDTVAVIIAKPPSASALIELLRIATPGLAESESSADHVVRDEARRERHFKTLKLRIHPDKHPGDERVTALYQDVQTFYDRCVEKVNEPPAKTTKNDNGSKVSGAATAGPASGTYPNQGRSMSGAPGYTPPYPNRPKNTYTPGAEPWRKPASTSTHSDYASYESQQRRRRRVENEFPHSARDRPPSHQCCAVVSMAAFLPLGICATIHSSRVKKAWDEGRYGDAIDHSTQAYNYAWFAYLIFIILFLYFWLRDGDAMDFDFDGFDFDHMFD